MDKDSENDSDPDETDVVGHLEEASSNMVPPQTKPIIPLLSLPNTTATTTSTSTSTSTTSTTTAKQSQPQSKNEDDEDDDDDETDDKDDENNHQSEWPSSHPHPIQGSTDDKAEFPVHTNTNALGDVEEIDMGKEQTTLTRHESDVMEAAEPKNIYTNTTRLITSLTLQRATQAI